MAQTRPLTLNRVSFPRTVQTGESARGLISYGGAQGGVDRVDFGVVDGRFRRVTLRPSGANATGQVAFELSCTSFSQAVSLRVVIQDKVGRQSEPALLQFDCGRPPIFNFSQEQARVRPTTEKITVHFFILDDGVTSLSQHARDTGNPLWSEPSAEVKEAIQQAILPALTGIWDQCSLSFELGQVRVVHPEFLTLAQGSFDALLFSNQAGHKMIRHGARAGTLLNQAELTLSDELRGEGTPITLDNLVVFITGSPIVTTVNGQPSDIEGFGELSTLVQGFSLAKPRYAIVRWGALFFENGRPIVPKQVVATLAHELGHNLGLKHPGEDNLRDTLADENNLMKGSGVTPEPRSDLLNSQCQQFLKILSATRRQARSWAFSASPGRFAGHSGLAIVLPAPEQGDLERGFVESRNAANLVIRNNSTLSWEVRVSSEDADMGTDGAYHKPLADFQVRVSGERYLSISNAEQLLFRGGNGEVRFSVDYRVLYAEKAHAKGKYRVGLIYTLSSR